MTIDKQKLKALAEASLSGEWYAVGDLRFSDDKTGGIHGLHHDDSRLIEAASPATILALLAEIERLQENQEYLIDLRDTHGFDSWSAALVEIDRLKAENDSLRDGANFRAIQSLRDDCDLLRKDAERYRWLKHQRSKTWREAADVPMNHTDAHIDEAMAKEAK